MTTATAKASAKRVFKRRQFIRYATPSKETSYGVVVSNDTGNRFSEIIAVIECTPMPTPTTALETTKEGVIITVKGETYLANTKKLRTISKDRVKRILGNVSNGSMKEIGSSLKDTYMNPKIRTFVYVQRGYEMTEGNVVVVGSEQIGQRPALLLEWVMIENIRHAVVAYMSRKIKKEQPTQVRFEKGEGGLQDESVCMLEQIDLVPAERIVKRIGTPSPDKMNQVIKAFGVSMGLVRA